MADTKLTALSQFTPATEDLLYAVDDPSGSPVSGKITIESLFDILQSYSQTNESLIIATQSVTGSASDPIIQLVATFNTTSYVNPLLIDVTNTASAADSGFILCREQPGNNARFAVTASGNVGAGSGDETTAAYFFVSDGDTGMFRQAANVIGWTVGGTENMRLSDKRLQMLRTGGLEDVTSSSGTTGGTGSAGAGSQYIEITVQDGTTYKVLHDGTV